MATYAQVDPIAAGPGMGGNVKVSMSTLNLGTAIVANDILNFGKIPAGGVVFGGWMQAADLDTGTEVLDADVGWLVNADEVADPDGFGNFGVLTGDAITGIKPEVGLYYPLGGVLFTAGPKLFTAETTISIDVNVSPNAGGTGIITVAAFYVMDESFTAQAVS